MNLSRLQEIVKDRGAWWAEVHGITKNWTRLQYSWGFLGSSDGKESACKSENEVLIPGLGRSPGEGHGYSLQYSCLENSMDRGAWQAAVHGVSKSWIRPSDWVTNTFTFIEGLDPPKLHVTCRFLLGEKDNPRGYFLTVGYSSFVSNSSNLFW